MRIFQRHIQNESGAILIASFLLLVLLTGAGLSGFTTTAVNQNKSQNLLNSKQAFYLAEAGIQHGRLYLYNQYAANNNIWNTYSTAQPQTLIASTGLAGIGTYSVTIQDASGPALLMRATGTGPNNASATIESLVTIGYANLEKAFVAGRNVTISGNAIIDGSLFGYGPTGGVHANRNLTITANPNINADATASGTYTVTGTPTIGGIAAGSQPQVTINRVMVPTYFPARDYLLNSNGLVYNANRTKLTTSPVTWSCWTPRPVYAYNRKKRLWYVRHYWWELTCGDNKRNGTFYVSGNVVISADVGTVDDPWITTIIATGYIKVSSDNLYMRRPLSTETTLFKSQTANMLFLANTDILIVGTEGQNLTGIIRAREQIGISGDPTITGYIVAQDEATRNRLVAGNFISGALHLTYNGDMNNGLQGQVLTMTTMY